MRRASMPGRDGTVLSHWEWIPTVLSGADKSPEAARAGTPKGSFRLKISSEIVQILGGNCGDSDRINSVNHLSAISAPLSSRFDLNPRSGTEFLGL